MHPILTSVHRLTLYVGASALVGALFAAAYASASGALLPEAFVTVVPLSIVYSFVCLSAWYVCSAVPLGVDGIGRVLAAQTGAAVLATAAWVLLWEAWTRVIAGTFAEGLEHYRSQVALTIAVGALLFWLAVMLHYLLIAFEDSRRAETRELGLEVLAREAELKALRAQIDPHFLFNSLHSMSALTATDPAGARRMSLLLADFFRASVRLGAANQITLGEEMEMVRQYLEIEKVRCGSRLTVSFEVDSMCATCRIPPFLLQPLVENSVRHGIGSLVGGGRVTVVAACDQEELTLRVSNPFDDEQPRKTGAGVGLANVTRRLETLFGNRAETHVAGEKGVFEVELRLPCPNHEKDRINEP